MSITGLLLVFVLCGHRILCLRLLAAENSTDFRYPLEKKYEKSTRNSNEFEIIFMGLK